MLLNLWFTSLILFIITLNLIADNQKAASVDVKATLLITMTWSDQSSNDVDLWLLTPTLDKIGYRNTGNSYANLERDDVGMENDFTTVNGEYKQIYLNQEVIKIRQSQPGKYVINVNYFKTKENPITHIIDKGPIPVKIQLTQVEPTYKVVYTTEVVVNVEQEEVTAFSFDINDDKTVSNIETEQIPFIFKDFNQDGE